MKAVAVFCGSSSGYDPIYETEAERLGRYLAEKGIVLVYGGAKVGLMGAVAEGALRGGGEVIGVLPRALQHRDVAREGLSQLIWTDTMHERKAVMAEKADGFIALPGGFGTLDETFEALTWLQLGIHQKPVGLLNIAEFYNPLLEMLHIMVERGFLKPSNRDMLVAEESISALLLAMETYTPPTDGKWIARR